ncbi:uncharacterized protein YhfT [Kineothrix alysoides]|uniref:Uncharacterized protein YhfT n=1 Tax=Kineothrix alysoides TaxID=1469948 RepID=A0A4R1R3X8_9FIRM|nr:YhfT family protein [Kineothrix alysoides]TCL60119.1 uncharacterized protein YhfT [Kineothrix alysoides]
MNFFEISMVMILCGVTALISHMGMAVFQDGLRPIVPECTEGRMKRKELKSIAFGLSVGFIGSVGLVHTLATGLLNPWLLFLATDILGIMARRKWTAFLYGGIWGAVCSIGIVLLFETISSLPVDIIGSLDVLSKLSFIGFSLFPIVAVYGQHGARKGMFSTAVIGMAGLLSKIALNIDPLIIITVTGICLLYIYSFTKDIKEKTNRNIQYYDEFTDNYKKLKKNAVWLMLCGGIISAVAGMGIFGGSEVSIYILAQQDKTARIFASTAELIRSLGFIPLITTAAVTTGVYGVAGFTLCYSIGYLIPHPAAAGVAGALVILLELLSLKGIDRFFTKFPSVRETSDHIRSSMMTVMEFTLLIGSMMAVFKMGGYLGFILGAGFYFINEATGKKVMKIAIGPLSVIAAGIVLNILKFTQLI